MTFIGCSSYKGGTLFYIYIYTYLYMEFRFDKIPHLNDHHTNLLENPSGLVHHLSLLGRGGGGGGGRGGSRSIGVLYDHVVGLVRYRGGSLYVLLRLVVVVVVVVIIIIIIVVVFFFFIFQGDINREELGVGMVNLVKVRFYHPFHMPSFLVLLFVLVGISSKYHRIYFESFQKKFPPQETKEREREREREGALIEGWNNI